MDTQERFQREIGARLQLARETLGWNRAELAARSGQSPENIRLIEIGETNPGVYTLQQLAQALGLSVARLVPDAMEESSSPPPTRRAPKPLAPRANRSAPREKGTYNSTATSVRSQLVPAA